MPRFPIDRYLLPEHSPDAVPAGFVALRQPITGGLPHRVDIDQAVHAFLVLPTGLARQWSDADPLDVVSSSETDLAPRPVADPQPPALVPRAPLRLVVRQGTAVIGAIPLAAGLRRGCGPVEILVCGWRLCAGSVRGAGDYGSYLSLAWRPADKAVDVFGTPPVHRFVLRRKPLALRIESELGELRPEYLRLADKRLRRRWIR